MSLQAKYTPETRKLITAGWNLRQKQIRARKRYLDYDLQLSSLISKLRLLGIEIPDSWNKR